MKNLYAIFDEVACEITNVFIANNDELAKRMLKNAIAKNSTDCDSLRLISTCSIDVQEVTLSNINNRTICFGSDLFSELIEDSKNGNTENN